MKFEMDFNNEHMKRIIQLEPAINQLFENFIQQTAPHLKRIKSDGRGIWSRNPLVEKQVDQAVREFAKRYKDLLRSYMIEEWEFSEKKNDSIFMKLLKGAGITIASSKLLNYFNRQSPPQGVKVDLDTVVTLTRNTAARDAFLKNRLDQVISPRVWDLASQNKTLILRTAETGILEGKSAAGISQDLRKYLREPSKLFRRIRDPKTGKLVPSKPMAAYHPGQGVYRSSYKNALRLARHETNMAYRAADLERWRGNPGILGYEVQTSGNAGREPDICDELTGRYPKEFTWLAWHVGCWCRAVPILPDPDTFVDHLVNDTPITGHVKGIPKQSIDYINQHSEKLLKMKTKPYWLRDNFKVDGKKIKLNIT